MYECTNARMRECANARMRECANVRMRECANARMRECANVRKCECANARFGLNPTPGIIVLVYRPSLDFGNLEFYFQAKFVFRLQ